MAQFSGYPQLLAFLPPDERIKHGNLRANDGAAGNSTYTQAGRRPGRPVYQRGSIAESSTTIGDLGPDVDLVATGEQADVTYTAVALRGGMPGEDLEIAVSDDGGTVWRYWQTPNVVEWVAGNVLFDRGDGTVGHNYGMATLATGDVLVVCARSSQLVCKVYDPGAHTIDSSYTVIADQAPTQINDDDATHGWSGLLFLVADTMVVESGRAYAYVLHEEIDGILEPNYSLGVYYSDDHALTWRTANFFGLDVMVDSATDTAFKIRVESHLGNALLMLQYTAGGVKYLRQYASSDGGLNFKLIEDWQDTATQGAAPCITVDRATGIFTVLYYDPSGTNIEYRRIANPFLPLLSVTATTLSAANTGNMAAATDPDGTQYVTYNAGGAITYMAWSRDGGATWTQTQTDPLNIVQSSIGTWDICCAHSRIVWLLNDFSGGLADADLILVESGGWNTIVQPRAYYQQPTENFAWGGGAAMKEGATWLPTALPSAYGWTTAGTGTSTLATATPLGVTLDSSGGAAKSVYNTRTPTGEVENGVAVQFGLQVTAGGSMGTSGIAVFLDLDDGVSRYAVAINFSTTQVQLWDTAAAASRSIQSLDTSTQRTYKVAIRPDSVNAFASVTVYYRATSGDEWTTLITSTGVVAKSATATGANMVRWGHITASTTAVSTWGYFHYVMFAGRGVATRLFDDLSQNVLVANAAPYMGYGRRVPVAPYRVWVDQGLYYHGSGGPGHRGDRWVGAPAYDYPVQALDPRLSPSPTQTWRSTGETLARFAWTIGGGSGSYATDFGCASYGVIVRAANIGTATLKRWTGAAYTSIGTLNFSAGMIGLPYTITGDRVTVNTGAPSTGSQYIAYNELAGCTVKLVSGGTTKYRKVISNTEGAWTDTTTRRPTLVLAGVDGTEPATGTLDIWYRDAAFMVHNDANTFARIALELPAQTTADGYFELGSVLIGAAIIPAQRNALGRTIDTAQNVEVYTGLGGQRAARLLGPPRRVARVAWSDAFDATGVQGTAPVPDYVATRAGATPVGARGDLSLLEGMLRRFGAQVPIGYIDRVDLTSPGADTTTVAGRARVFVGRMMEGLTRTQTAGHENTSEVCTITGAVLEEEV